MLEQILDLLAETPGGRLGPALGPYSDALLAVGGEDEIRRFLDHGDNGLTPAERSLLLAQLERILGAEGLGKPLVRRAIREARGGAQEDVLYDIGRYAASHLMIDEVLLASHELSGMVHGAGTAARLRVDIARRDAARPHAERLLDGLDLEALGRPADLRLALCVRLLEGRDVEGLVPIVRQITAGVGEMGPLPEERILAALLSHRLAQPADMDAPDSASGLTWPFRDALELLTSKGN